MCTYKYLLQRDSLSQNIFHISKLDYWKFKSTDLFGFSQMEAIYILQDTSLHQTQALLFLANEIHYIHLCSSKEVKHGH